MSKHQEQRGTFYIGPVKQKVKKIFWQ